MGLSGVQRVVKFCKYLPENGWQPTVLTVHPGGYFAYDHTLEAEIREAGIDVVRTRSIDPTQLFGRQKTVPLPGEQYRSVMARLSNWIFVPDNKIGWLPFAVAAGGRVLRQGGFDAVFSSAPPYTGHMAASILARRFKLPHVADFRDDWLDNPRHHYPTRLHHSLHMACERFVYSRAAHLTAFNPRMAARIRSRIDGYGLTTPVGVLPHGFDPADFSAGDLSQDGSVFRVHYSGVFYDAQQPDSMLRAARALLDRRSDAVGKLRLSFAGLFPERGRALIETLGLEAHVDLLGYLPHDEAVRRLEQAHVLWTMVGRRPGADRVGTSKVYEYFGSRKPVLALAPEGVERDAVLAYPAGTVVDPDDVGRISLALEKYFDAWRENRLQSVDATAVAPYNRREIARQLALLLSE
jgi:glycosyltransferase involved in cell wall biosynthesis